MLFRNILACSRSDVYGIFIVLITIITRIFVVSIAWNYGIFLSALEKSFPKAKIMELGWIAGLAQGLGSILAPLYLTIARLIGIRLTFGCGLLLSCVSLFLSSLVNSPSYLFISYSIPFGIGSGMTMVIGSVLTGIYFPNKNRFHVLSTVLISLGFPLGFLILSPTTEKLIELYGWQIAKRIYGIIAAVFLIIFVPFFTDKFAPIEDLQEETNVLININQSFRSLRKFKYMVNLSWYFGLFLISIGTNSIFLNLNGFFISKGISPETAADNMIIFGSADMCYRIILAVCGIFFYEHLSVFYIISGLIGTLLCLSWIGVQSLSLNTFLTIVFAICPAVYMSLMYPVSTEINGASNIFKTYSVNVLVGGLGIIVGPPISGLLLDTHSHNYKTVFEMCAACFAFSIGCFIVTKIILVYISSYRSIDRDDTSS